MVEIKDMSFGYNGGLLFNDLSLRLEKGNIYGLLGLNGVGKTSLLKLISGLIFPKEGRIDVMGEEPRLRRPNWLSRVTYCLRSSVLPISRSEAMSHPVFHFIRVLTVISLSDFYGNLTFPEILY